MQQSLLSRYLGLILFLTMLVIGLLSYNNYGLAWDEYYQHYTGELNYSYIMQGDEQLLHWKDRDYGVAIELPLIFIEKTFGLDHESQIYPLRHLLCHIFFLFSAYCLFLLINMLYKNKWLATIGFLLLVLHPRIYAHSFFNSKDIPFLAMFIISFYTAARALFHKRTWDYVLVAIAVGLLINIRIMGVLMFAYLLFYLIWDGTNLKEIRLKIKQIGLFILVCLLSIYALWPFLWHNPFENFGFAFNNMSKFRFEGKVMHQGELILAKELDWSYLLIWIGITTPLPFLALGLGGTITTLIDFLKKPLHFFKDASDRNQLMYLASCYVPLLAVFALHSVVYDSWRHVFFIYPSFILLGIYGLNKVKQNYLKYPIYGILGLYFLGLSIFMIQNYPHQQVYFNYLLPSENEYIRKNYELDYWGTSYKQALEYLLKTDDRELIKVAVKNFPGELNWKALKPEDRNRIKIVGKAKADYFISNYRGHPQDYSEYKDQSVFSIQVRGNTIMEVFELR